MKKILSVSVVLFLVGCVPHINYTVHMTGDCVDKAVIIRQDLRAEGYEAELVIGKIKLPSGEIKGHAWVKYKDKKTGEWKNIYNFKLERMDMNSPY